jgi:peptide/nickel transport system substrate-binding protein
VNQANWWKSIDTPDKSTLVLTSDQPRPLVFDWLEQFCIADPQTMPTTAAPQTAVGTGPFKFVEWVQGDHFTLARNESYWTPGRPYLDGIVINILRDATAMSVALEAGQLDVMFSPNLQDFVRLKADPKFQALAHPGNDRGHLLGANVLQPPMDNKLVRQAVNYAMDRQRFVDTVLKGVGAPEFLFWNPRSLAYEANKQNAYPFDLSKAKSLLDQAGVSNLEFDYLVGPTGPGYDFGQLYQGDLATIGVKMNIRTLQGADFLSMINNRQYSGLYYASASAQAEPASALTYSKAWDPNNNNQGFKDDTYTNLITTVATEPDPQKRKALYSQINDIFVDQAFVSAIAVLTIIEVATSKLQDITPLAHDAFSYKNAWLNA